MRDLSLHLMDIIQNSISAKSSKIAITISADKSIDELKIVIADNGVGMDKEFLSKVTDPFETTRKTRKVGLGISLFKASAQMASGKLIIDSVKGKGTVLRVTFQITHIDRLPLGDIAETITGVIVAWPDIELELALSNETESIKLNSFEVKEKLGDVPITQYEVIAWIKEFINEGVRTIFGGVLDEIIS